MDKTFSPKPFEPYLEQTPNKAEIDELNNSLDVYNDRYAESINVKPLGVFIKDSDGKLAGGLYGVTYWGWLYIETLWLRDDLRGQGYGQRLVGMAEEEAVRRGCHSAHVDTMDFQAPEFYEKLGYQRWGALEDLPVGHRRIFFKKQLETK